MKNKLVASRVITYIFLGFVGLVLVGFLVGCSDILCDCPGAIFIFLGVAGGGITIPIWLIVLLAEHMAKKKASTINQVKQDNAAPSEPPQPPQSMV